MSLGYEQVMAKITETRDMGTVSLAEMIARQPPELRRELEDLVDELLAERATLREIRERQKIAQVELAAELGIGQECVSRLERRNDALVSTIRKAVEAMGGDLHIIAEFPDRGRVELSGFGEA